MTGAILWFTGMSGAGKSTLAAAVGAQVSAHRPVEILDGDVVRTHLSKGLGFSREDRDTNVRRIGFVARLLAKHGVFVITAAISPYANIRDEVRALAAADGLAFIEVFVGVGGSGVLVTVGVGANGFLIPASTVVISVKAGSVIHALTPLLSTSESANSSSASTTKRPAPSSTTSLPPPPAFNLFSRFC